MKKIFLKVFPIIIIILLLLNILESVYIHNRLNNIEFELVNNPKPVLVIPITIADPEWEYVLLEDKQDNTKLNKPNKHSKAFRHVG